MSGKAENEYEPDVVTPPGETLQETLDALGMSKVELAGRIGMTQKTVGDIIKHGKPITPATAMKLEKVFRIPASFWNNRERRFRESLARQKERKRLEASVDWLKTIPVREMIKCGLIEKHKDTVEQLHEVLRYFGVASPEQWKAIWTSPDAAYRRSKVFISKPGPNSVWLRWGELQAQQIQCDPFNKKSFRKTLEKIRTLTRTGAEQFQEDAAPMCGKAGVALVFTPPIKGAPVTGATRWLSPSKALIQLSMRGKWEDILWFTFFHEAGHILLHGKRDIFIEGNGNEGHREEQANRFAQDFLIPPADYRDLVDGRTVSQRFIKSFAARLDISPAVVVGRLQHDGHLKNYAMNNLRRRFDFANGKR